MFSPGEKVVYPMHGAGVIESLEEHEVLGKRQRYYVLRLLVSGMRVMIPVDSAKRVGLRMVITEDKVPKVIEILKGKKTEIISDWKTRYNKNLEKMKSGSIYRVAEVVRSLSIQDRKKGLSLGERRLLDNACQLIVEELSYAQNKPISVMKTMLGEILNRFLE